MLDDVTLVSSLEVELAVSALDELVLALDVALLELVLELDVDALDVELPELLADDVLVAGMEPVTSDTDVLNVESPPDVPVSVDELCGISLTVLASSLAAQPETQ